jgi:hypothetical protein
MSISPHNPKRLGPTEHNLSPSVPVRRSAPLVRQRTPVCQCASAPARIYTRAHAHYTVHVQTGLRVEGQCAEELVSSLGIFSTKTRKEYDR